MAKRVIDLSGAKGFANYVSSNGRNNRMPSGTLSPDEGAVFNPFIRSGYMSPGTSNSTSVTFDNALGGTPECAIYDPINDDFYIADGGTQLYKGDGISDTALTRSVNITGAEIKDLAIYSVNDVPKLFVMYKDSSGDAEIAISSLPYDSAADDVTWLSATVSGAFSDDANGDIFLVPADNGLAYLFNEYAVHTIDGTSSGGANGTVTQNTLLFPGNFRLVDAIDTGGNLIIGVHQFTTDTRNPNPGYVFGGPTECGIYVWDRRTTVVGTKDYIKLPGVRQISKIYQAPSGSIRLMVTTTKNLNEIREYDGYGFRTIAVTGSNTFPVYRHSVKTMDNMVIWNGRDGMIHGHGKAESMQESEVLYQLWAVSVASTHGGAILPASKTTNTGNMGIYFGYLNVSSAAKLVRIEMATSIGGYTAQTKDTTTLKFAPEYFSPDTTLKDLYVSCYLHGAASPVADGTATLKVYINRDTNPTISREITLRDVKYGEVRIPMNLKHVSTMQIEIVHGGDVTTTSTNDFAPAYAIVTYEENETRRR